MDAFSYLSVLISIILGLAVTQALQGVRSVMLTRGELKIFVPSLVWTGIVILICVQFWWASFGLRDHQNWTFPGFAIVILQTLCLYLLAALVLPDIAEDRAIDLEAHYFRQRPWFFGVFFLMLAVSLTKDVMLSGALPSGENLAFHGLFAAGALSALVIRSVQFHFWYTLAVAAATVAYIALLFAKL